MKLLLNRKFTIFITVAIVVISTFFGVHRSLGRLARDIEATFYNGVYLEDEGYTQPGVSSHLESSSNAALAFAATMANYPELSEKAAALQSARRGLMDAKGIQEKSTANNNMMNAFTELLQTSMTVEITQRDLEDAARYWATFRNAQININVSRYNIEAARFDREVSFIADMINSVFPVKPPEVFRTTPVPVIDYP